MREVVRKTPEELLREVQAEEAAEVRKGHLKIFLGYASGVGKSFRMIDEARRRHERGQDVVVGAVQPRVAPEVDSVLKKLEVMPLKNSDGGSAIDIEALIRRHPAVCVIDGLAYDNPPGLRNATRWEDARDLLNVGIKVIATINVQYVAELGAQVEAITGKHVTQTVPLSFIKSADEIEIVDAPPPEDTADAVRREQLLKLRELTLVVAADVVDHQLTSYLERHGIQQHFGTYERILVCVTPRANVCEMIETARTIAERFHGEMMVAYVNQGEDLPADRAILEDKLSAARAAGTRIEVLEGEDPVDTLLEFAKSQGITQIFIGHSRRSGIAARLLGNPVDKLIRRSQGMDVRVFPN